MRMRRFFRQALPITAFLCANPSFAQDAEMIGQHTHVHGHWRMFAAIDGKELTLSLSGPAADVLGFEHIPQTEAEREAVRLLSETLGAPETVALSPAAKCKPAAPPELVLPEGFGARQGADDNSHSSHHERNAEEPGEIVAEAHDDDDHDEHGDARQEAEIEAVYVFSCSAPRKLDRIEHRLFDLYPSIEEVEAVFLTDAKQGAQALTRSAPDLRLR